MNESEFICVTAPAVAGNFTFSFRRMFALLPNPYVSSCFLSYFFLPLPSLSDSFSKTKNEKEKKKKNSVENANVAPATPTHDFEPISHLFLSSKFTPAIG